MEVIELISLLCSIGEFNFMLERRDVHVWSLDPLEGLLVNLLLVSFGTAPTSQTIFDALWRIKILKLHLKNFTRSSESYESAFEKVSFVRWSIILYSWLEGGGRIGLHAS